jgi:hypothetical protein
MTWWGQQWCHCKCPGKMVKAIAQAPASALACVASVTGKGRDGKAAVFLVAIVVTVVVPEGGQGQRRARANVCVHVA